MTTDTTAIRAALATGCGPMINLATVQGIAVVQTLHALCDEIDRLRDAFLRVEIDDAMFSPPSRARIYRDGVLIWAGVKESPHESAALGPRDWSREPTVGELGIADPPQLTAEDYPEDHVCPYGCECLEYNPAHE